ncbi:WD domain, G-beta repeat protein [Cooperia oncophora]
MLSSSRLPSLAEVPVGGEDAPMSSVRERAGSDHSTRTTKRQGRIVPARPGTGGQYRVVTRTATVEGHSKAVLSVAATDELLLSGSKDRTAKLWDLQTGSEVRTLGVHPNNVHAVRFIPNSQLAISVSMYQNIMKFSLLDQKRDHLELNAHNSFIQGMCLVGVSFYITPRFL